MTWTIYNNDKAWGFLSEVEKFAFLLHWKPGGIILAHSFETGWVNLDLSLQFKGTVKQPSDYPNRVYRAAPEPTPAVDADQTAQLDIANARIAELEAEIVTARADALRDVQRIKADRDRGMLDYCALMERYDAAIQNPTTEEAP
jgi:hypothetical protein